jgi:ketosteroid isomerase-like protein
MAPEDFPDSPLLAYVKRLWIHGFVAGLAVVLVILSLWYFIWGWPLGSAPEGQEETKPTLSQTPATPARPPAPSSATAQPSATLKAEVEAVLAKLAEANRNKDLPQLLSLYDPTFPDLQQKAEEISRTWKVYDYRSLRFRIDEIRSQSPGNASAKVIWEAETRNRSTHEIKVLSKTYLVWLTNDSGQWRIRSLEKAGTPGEQEKTG